MKTILTCFLLIFLSFANYGHGHCPKFGKNHKSHGSGANHLGSLYVREKDPRKVWKTVPSKTIIIRASGPKKLQNLTKNKDGNVHIFDIGNSAKGISPLGGVLMVTGDTHSPSGLFLDGQDIHLVNENVVRNLQLTAGP